jgi:hypothetical protein
MFANPKYSHKTAPVFTDSARFASEGENLYVSALRPAIMNDEDDPPKALIELDMYLIPMNDYKSGEKWKKMDYDLEASICLTPEDTIKLVRYLNYLLSEIFKDYNYIRR